MGQLWIMAVGVERLKTSRDKSHWGTRLGGTYEGYDRQTMCPDESQHHDNEGWRSRGRRGR
eukprot:scaffold1130_cov127-Isochrysis_galbana.AAC.6